MKRLSTPLLCAGLALSCTLRFSSASAVPEGRESVRVGSRVPALAYEDLSGRTVERDWSDGPEATLFFFFDIRTSSGLYGLTFLEAVSRKAGDFGLEVLAVEGSGISREETMEKLERYESVYSALSIPLAVDGSGALLEAFGVGALPAVFIVERHGVIIDHRKGFDERTENAIGRKLESLLHLPGEPLSKGAEGDIWDSSPADPPADRPLLFPGDSVPPLVVTDMKGGEHRFLWASGEAEIHIFFFFNDPCRQCIEEMLFLDQLHRRTTAIGLPISVLAVEAGGLDAREAGALLEKYSALYPVPPYPIVLDSAFDLTRTFGRGSLPSTYILDETGKVLVHAEGFDGDRVKEWRDLIENRLPRSRGALRFIPD